jgi:hypothetical protein
MSEKIRPYHVIDLPPERREVLNFNELNWRKHCMYGLLEVDVTVARQFIDEHKARTGELLSFTGYLAFCLARAVDALFLSVLPLSATWQAFTALGWTNRWAGRIAAGVLALASSLLVIAVYHLGYPEFRGPQVILVVVGVGIQSLLTLLTGSPIVVVLGHIAMHITAVLYGLNSVSQLPPHY